VVGAEEPDYPGLCRVILGRHAVEMTDLDEGERASLMAVVFAVEEAVRETMRPDKMNLASLGNVVPHVHWHLIPRFRDDRHFPGPIWSAPKREAAIPPERRARAEELGAAIRARLERFGP
jgi:diadenosine tetraphosphate (Ap4A) HIT family hydrolase